MVLKIVKHVDVFSGASFLVHFYEIFMNLIPEFFCCCCFLITNMESSKCKKNAILNKKLEIKSIINDFREFIEVYGSNYSEKTMMILLRI